MAGLFLWGAEPPAAGICFAISELPTQRDGHMATHVLVVDDDLDVLAVLVEMLNVSGFITTAATSGLAMRESDYDRRKVLD
jgi:PleD family two-component response regulator